MAQQRGQTIGVQIPTRLKKMKQNSNINPTIMPTYCKEHYTDENGLIITASQGRLLERRKRVAELYKEMLPRYASFRALYQDIADILTSEQQYGFASAGTVVHDLKQMGLHNTTQQSRMSNNIRKEPTNDTKGKR